MSYFQMTSMILTSCQTNSVQLDSKAEGGGGSTKPPQTTRGKGKASEAVKLVPAGRQVHTGQAGWLLMLTNGSARLARDWTQTELVVRGRGTGHLPTPPPCPITGRVQLSQTQGCGVVQATVKDPIVQATVNDHKFTEPTPTVARLGCTALCMVHVERHGVLF